MSRAVNEKSTGVLSAVEQRGIEPVPQAERNGNPMELFWVWFAANISVLGLPLGVSMIGLGLSVWQAILAIALGSFGSFAIVGLISVAGKRGAAPSLTLSRAIFGVRGNAIPTLIALLSRWGWETVNSATAALSFISVCALLFGTAGTAAGAPWLAVLGVLLFVAATAAVSGIGYDAILLVQKYATWIFGAINLVVIIYLATRLDWQAVTSTPGGNLAAILTGVGIIAGGTGIGWATSGADMSRYQHPSVKASSLVLSAAAGAGIPLTVIISMGAMIGASSERVLNSPNPMDAIGESLPTWVAVIYLVVSFFGLLLSNHLSVYSAGFTTITLGIRLPRVYAVILDIVVTTTLALLFLLVADDFYGPFITFISLLSVPLAAWIGVFLVDMITRTSYDQEGLLDLKAGGRYWYSGGVRWSALLAWLAATFVAFLFMEIQPGAEPIFTGPFVDTWVGANGMAWLLAAVLAGILYALSGGLKKDAA